MAMAPGTSPCSPLNALLYLINRFTGPCCELSILVEVGRLLEGGLYDMRHILVPSARRPVFDMTKARVSGRMAMERDPVGESTKV